MVDTFKECIWKIPKAFLQFAQEANRVVSSIAGLAYKFINFKNSKSFSEVLRNESIWCHEEDYSYISVALIDMQVEVHPHCRYVKKKTYILIEICFQICWGYLDERNISFEYFHLIHYFIIFSDYPLVNKKVFFGIGDYFHEWLITFQFCKCSHWIVFGQCRNIRRYIFHIPPGPLWRKL